MFTQPLFELALNINDPWYIKDIQFSAENKRLVAVIFIIILSTVCFLKPRSTRSPVTPDFVRNYHTYYSYK